MPGDRTEQATRTGERKRAKTETFSIAGNWPRPPARWLASCALGCSAAKILTPSAASFSTSLDLGARRHWEAATLQPTLLAMRRLILDALIPVGIVDVGHCCRTP